MTPVVVDTDTFSLFTRRHPKVVAEVRRRRDAKEPPPLAVITAEEVWGGLMALVAKARTPERQAAAYRLLTDTLNELRNWPIVGFLLPALVRYAELKRLKLNVGANDLKIAAIALELGAAVVTHNTRDFGRVPGLAVVDWAA